MRRRTLSQNFLRDRRGTGIFLAALPPPDGLPGVEVGAGDGALTVDLARHFGALTAWELDPAMAGRLAARVHGLPQVRVETGDFLASAPPGSRFHLAGNVPFGITAGVVGWCLGARTLVSATLITQLEYARKRTGDYGRWSLTTVASWPSLEWRLAGRIPRAAFRPVPSVDAGVLALRRRARPLLPPRALRRWEEVVARGFGGVGGSLSASLRPLYAAGDLDAAFSAAGIGRREVVAFVHPDRWLTAFRRLERI